MSVKKIVVVGAGLIGTSIALGAKKIGAEVELLDEDGRAQALANDLVGASKVEDPSIVVIAAPTSALGSVLNRYKTLYPKSTFIDIGSTKTKVKAEVGKYLELAPRFCPTHPMAGRELDGAEAAQSDLFEGKSWVITPLNETSKDSIELTKELIESLGARVIIMSPEAHDLAVATVSHLPQIISSILAAQLVGKDPDYLALAGSGVLDTTRIAGSNSQLWREILNLNRDALIPLLKDFQKDLSTLIDTYDVQEILERGRMGRQSLPGKHRSASRNYIYLPVVIEDKPNQLALLFNECGKAKVNVEDIAIEHSPEQNTGLVLLALSSDDANILNSHLNAAGWRVHPPRSEK